MDTSLLVIQNLGRQIQDVWILLLWAIAVLDLTETGTLVFQGKPISDWFIPCYRTQVIYLHQRPALLEGTVEQNLLILQRL